MRSGAHSKKGNAMTIMISARKGPTLDEATHTVTFPLDVHVAREMVGNCGIGNNGKEIVWMGQIWDRPAPGINYPPSPYDITVDETGTPHITVGAVFGLPLVRAWIKQFVTQPMIIQVPV
jgi:hypothetical protein